AHLNYAVVVFGHEEALDLACALCILPLAHDHGRRLLLEWRGPDAARDVRGEIRWARGLGAVVSHRFYQGANMLRTRAAAAPHYTHAKLVYELVKVFRHRLGHKRVDSLLTEVHW